ncbi:hypothetical protein PYCCODRAFT_1149908 [Trametes coccinea BRFM310]|uniref:Uncharacterized protein n=1 Tax=Trametes coccinea (strain BRFM310) TaxID=1353009 RepID=A0A1Y2I809_TRAC3|nr:hypothetical protein PYCCODRAFT_1149908 [Trametes coccinea BRFM310]
MIILSQRRRHMDSSPRRETQDASSIIVRPLTLLTTTTRPYVPVLQPPTFPRPQLAIMMSSRAVLTHEDTVPTTMIRLTTSAPKRLPKELWEHIIDHCVPPSLDLYSEKQDLRYSIFESSITFLACALTCRDWLARSLVNLYSVCIILEDYKSVDRLVEIITMRPHFAPFVRTLWVSPEAFIYPGSHLGHPVEQYIPFVRTELIHRLTNLHTIAYLGPYWWPYPAVYNLHIARYRSLKTLYLACWFRSPTEMFRLIWTLEKLQDLHLHSVQFDVYPQDSLDPTYERLRNLAIQRPRCKSLESLMINVSGCAHPKHRIPDFVRLVEYRRRSTRHSLPVRFWYLCASIGFVLRLYIAAEVVPCRYANCALDRPQACSTGDPRVF